MEPQVHIRAYPSQEKPHQHDYHQLVLPCAGTMELRATEEGCVTNSFAAFVRAGELHSFSAAASSQFIVLDIPTNRDDFRLRHVPTFFYIDPPLRSLLEYFRASKTMEDWRKTAWFSLLLHHLVYPDGPAEDQDIILRRGLDFMRCNMASHLTAADIARAAGTSVSGLQRLMRDKMKTTPGACLSSMRLDKAEQLLAEANMSISEIAAITGYAEQSALNRALRRERSITPGQVRAMAKRKQ